MSNAQVSTARKFATGLFAGVVALSLMVPAQLAYANVYVGYDEDGAPNEVSDGTVDANGVGSEGGTWSYTADGQQMTLVDYVGDAIVAWEQDLNIQLEGDNTIYGGDVSMYDTGVTVYDGDVTITGDASVYGKDKPSLSFKAKEEAFPESAGIITNPRFLTVTDDDDAQTTTSKGDITIKDANIYVDAKYGGAQSMTGNLTIENSGIYRGAGNESLFLGATSYGEDSVVLLKGSEIEATQVVSLGTMTIDNTNLTVTPSSFAKEDIADDPDYVWIRDAVFAVQGIELKGEANGEVKEWKGEDGETIRYYVYTGSDDKVELKASETPAYYGPKASKAMPKTGDSTMAIVFGAGTALVLSAAAAAFALRRRNEER